MSSAVHKFCCVFCGWLVVGTLSLPWFALMQCLFPPVPRDGAGAHGRWTARHGAPAGSGTGSHARSGADTGTGSCQHGTQAVCARNWPCLSPANSSGTSGLISLRCIMFYTLLPRMFLQLCFPALFVVKTGNTYSNVVYFMWPRIFFFI